MTTLQPRPPYTQEELEKLYPKELQLQLVQVVSLLRARITEGRSQKHAGWAISFSFLYISWAVMS